MKLPSPSNDQLAHSERLTEVIAGEISKQGPINFAHYMQMALYQPGLGYYSAGATKFGAAGDYVTAPLISPLFSKCVAKQCQQILVELQGGNIFELGAGTGVMALDILTELERLDSLPQSYFILEVSADLRERQQQLFADKAPHFLQIVHWLDALPESPISGVILANEVIDAMPVHRFLVDETLQDYCVDYREGRLHWVLRPAGDELVQAVGSLVPHKIKGYSSEVNLKLKAWFKSLSEVLLQGIMLFIDYGYVRSEYYHPERSMGTLLCHFQQHAHDDPLIYPGIQDITAFVDFTAVVEAASEADLELCGFTHQAGFLMGCGLMQYINHELDPDPVTTYQQAQDVKRLTSPGEMGERFKALALGKNCDSSLIGFSNLDQSHKL